MADNEPVRQTKITGKDEILDCDVIFEDDFNKLVVKSTTIPDNLPNLQFITADNGGAMDLAVNGSLGSPVIFTIDAPALGQPNLIVKELRFTGFDNGIKIDNFMAQNSPLTNGIKVEIMTAGVLSTFPLIKTTADFESHFAFGAGGKYQIIVGSGDDFVSATFSPSAPFKLINGTSDQIKVTIQDNLNTISALEFIAFGFKDT